MNRIEQITQSTGWKKFMAKLYGLGAAVVIVGALFKIQHWPGAGIMLTVGLLTEAVIFFFSAFEPIHKETDWSLVYPELAGMHDEEEGGEGKEHEAQGTITEQLDNMLEEAKIGPELLESVGAGLRSLGETTSKLSDITDASAATEEYAKNVRGAAESVGDLSKSSSRAAQVMGDFANSSEQVSQTSQQINSAAGQYKSEMESASKNVAALNAVYEMQLKDSNEQLKSTAQAYAGMSELMKNLQDSVEDTKRYRQEVEKLAGNLSALNTVYGNMLAAMNVNR